MVNWGPVVSEPIQRRDIWLLLVFVGVMLLAYLGLVITGTRTTDRRRSSCSDPPSLALVQYATRPANSERRTFLGLHDHTVVLNAGG